MISDELKELSRLIKLRNQTEVKGSRIIGRPFIIGHIGEYIASEIFDIELNKSASAKDHDGYFRSGKLKGSTVNIKYYSRKGRLLDMCKTSGPDFYLVFMGSSETKVMCPWDIDSVYLFNDEELKNKLDKIVKIGVATSVRRKLWERAMIYPTPNNSRLIVSEEMLGKLELFKVSN